MDDALPESSLLRTVEGARAAPSAPIEPPRRDGGGPCFELFHAANSICSHKVRAVLAHHDVPWAGHSLDIFKGETYLPGYVRLRMLGCAHYGGALVAWHSGSTATSAGGCDGAVVPTLVDWESSSVIVDSMRICRHLDDKIGFEQRLRPPALSGAIDAELGIVDNLPNYQMLMGRNSGEGKAGATRSGIGSILSERKVAWCDLYLAAYPDDAPLVAAYTAKRAKELSAVDELFSAEAMRNAYARAKRALIDLDDRLHDRSSVWLFGERVTMADLFWGIELLRMDNVGAAHLWNALPHVARYAEATWNLPAIRSAIIDWPDATF